MINSSSDETQQTVFDRLLEPIEPFTREQESKLPKHHNQKFGYYSFFRLLMYYFASRQQSINLFIRTKLKLLPIELKLDQVAYSTFCEAFERYSVDLFRDVFKYILSTIPFKQIPELATLGILYCIDGSLFPVINSMLWAEYTSKHCALKLHVCFELNRMIVVEFLVTAANGNERVALLEMLKAGVTYIGDKGYMSFELCNEMVKRQAFFVFRIKRNIIHKTVEKLPVILPKSVQNLFKQVTDEMICFVNDGYKQTYRLVCFEVAGSSFKILTNRLDLTTFQVILLYAYRWQVELLFRYLKRTMNGIHLVRHDQNGVTIQFYAMLIVALLQLRLKQELADTQEISEESLGEIEVYSEIPEKTDAVPYEQENQHQENVISSEETKPYRKTQDEADVSCEQEELISSGVEFVKTVGENLGKYWKIGIHWLTTFRMLLAQPFDTRAIELLNTS